MFRKMRRINQALSKRECITILQNAPRGVLAVCGEDGYPYAFPMDYIYLDGKLFFHCAREGHKIDAIIANNHASFCVMNEGFRKEGHWALNISSIVLFGKVRIIKNQKENIETARKIAIKYYPTAEAAEEEVKKAADKVQILEFSIDHMTGKLVNES